ncbi:MAG: LysE family transporter [Pseudomonadota bacterium]
MIVNPMILPVGMMIGLLVAAPVGPVNVLCIQRALSRGPIGGIAAGLGAVFGDGLIALTAALGISLVVGFVETNRLLILLLGGLVLMAFGWRLYVTQPQFMVEKPDPSGTGADADGVARPRSVAALMFDMLKTFFLTVTNPGAVLGLFAIFGGIGTYVEITGRAEALVLVIAIMAGSLLWWCALSLLVGRFRHRLDNDKLARVNRIAGIALAIFGVVLIGEMAAEASGIL